MLDHCSVFSVFVVVAVFVVFRLFSCLFSSFFYISCSWFCRGFFVVAVVAWLFDLLVCRFACL